MGDSPNDRRRAERVPVNAQFAGVDGTSSYVSDLSEYGVFVHADQGLPIGSVVDLQFTIVLDDPVLLRGRGRIVRRQKSPPGMGVEFMDLDPEMILRINDVVTRQRPRDSGPPLEADEAARTKVKAPHKIQARDLKLSPLPGEGDDNDPESATTLVNLKKVNVQILDEDDDGSEEPE